jgi:large subunit ribosomal protein L10e
MALRPGRCYTDIKNKPYTRVSQRRPRKSYVKGVPASKIHQFEMGSSKTNYPVKFYLVAGRDLQIRSNALEAARQMITKYLTTKLGENSFFLKILVYPHHVLRHNPMATGAGADRYSQGMRRSFGKPLSQAARVSENQRIIYASAGENSEETIKIALDRAAKKLPGCCKVVAG